MLPLASPLPLEERLLQHLPFQSLRFRVVARMRISCPAKRTNCWVEWAANLAMWVEFDQWPTVIFIPVYMLKVPYIWKFSCSNIFAFYYFVPKKFEEDGKVWKGLLHLRLPRLPGNLGGSRWRSARVRKTTEECCRQIRSLSKEGWNDYRTLTEEGVACLLALPKKRGDDSLYCDWKKEVLWRSTSRGAWDSMLSGLLQHS